jgi:hypothetical protein
MRYLTLVLIVVTMGTQAQSEIPMSGDYCPAFYDKKGDMCVPTKEATVAIVKEGDCPEKMIPVGNYCVTPERVTTIIPAKKD